VVEKRDREGAGEPIANLQSHKRLYANVASIASVSQGRIGAIPCVGSNAPLVPLSAELLGKQKFCKTHQLGELKDF